MTQQTKLPVFQVPVGPAVVRWEHVFAIDHKRMHNGKPVGDDKHNITVLLTPEAAEPALQACVQAANSLGLTHDAAIRGVVFDRMKPIEDEATKKLGFAYSLKAYSLDPVEVISRQGGRTIKPDMSKVPADRYPQFKLGIRQGATVHLMVGFRGFVGAKDPGISAFLNGVLLDEGVEPIQLPGGRPDARTLFGSMIEAAPAPAVPAALGPLAGLVQGAGGQEQPVQAQQAPQPANPLASLGLPGLGN